MENSVREKVLDALMTFETDDESLQMLKDSGISAEDTECCYSISFSSVPRRLIKDMIAYTYSENKSETSLSALGLCVFQSKPKCVAYLVSLGQSVDCVCEKRHQYETEAPEATDKLLGLEQRHSAASLALVCGLSHCLIELLSCSELDVVGGDPFPFQEKQRNGKDACQLVMIQAKELLELGVQKSELSQLMKHPRLRDFMQIGVLKSIEELDALFSEGKSKRSRRL